MSSHAAVPAEPGPESSSSLFEELRSDLRELTAADVAARGMWRRDLQRPAGHRAWSNYREAVGYAYHAVNALRAAGCLPPRPTANSREKLRVSPMPRFQDEEDLRTRALQCLDPYFTAEIEVEGRHCSGRALRIDAVLRPRSPVEWKDARPAFGVEFKLVHQRSGAGTTDFLEWVRQAMDYTHVTWSGYGRLPIFTCPTPLRLMPISETRLVFRLLGHLGVGKLAPFDGEGWALVRHGEHVLWSERRGVAEAKRSSLLPKVGSAG